MPSRSLKTVAALTVLALAVGILQLTTTPAPHSQSTLLSSQEETTGHLTASRNHPEPAIHNPQEGRPEGASLRQAEHAAHVIEVVDQDGTPLVGASVEVLIKGSPQPLSRLTTDASGHARLEGLRENDGSEYAAHTYAPHHLFQQSPLDIAQPFTRIVLMRGYRVDVRVTDIFSAPRAGVRIAASLHDFHRRSDPLKLPGVYSSKPTDHTGRAVLEVPDEGQYYVSCVEPGLFMTDLASNESPLRERTIRIPGDVVRIVVSEPYSLALKVVDDHALQGHFLIPVPTYGYSRRLMLYCRKVQSALTKEYPGTIIRLFLPKYPTDVKRPVKCKGYARRTGFFEHDVYPMKVAELGSPEELFLHPKGGVTTGRARLRILWPDQELCPPTAFFVELTDRARGSFRLAVDSTTDLELPAGNYSLKTRYPIFRWCMGKQSLPTFTIVKGKIFEWQCRLQRKVYKTSVEVKRSTGGHPYKGYLVLSIGHERVGMHAVREGEALSTYLPLGHRVKWTGRTPDGAAITDETIMLKESVGELVRVVLK